MARVVVIGAGIVGASAAHRLSGAGVEVTLVDNQSVGGATAAGAGIVATISSRSADAETEAFRFAAARYYPELVEICSEAGLSGHSYAAVGQLTLAADDPEAEALSTELTRASALVGRFGPAAVGRPELLTSTTIRSRFPLVGPTAGGLWLPEVARVDGDAMRRALVELAVRSGATRVTGSATPEVRSRQVIGARTEHGIIEADAVLVAAGAWSGPMTHTAVQPQRGQIVHLRLPGAAQLPTLDTAAGHYLLTFPGDRVVIGATRETGSGFDPSLTAGGVAQVLRQGVSLVPALAGATWIEARVGLRPVSHDGLPYLGALPAVDGLWVATGMGPSGLTVGPYCGAVVADHILASFDGNAAPAIPASYRPDRA